MANANNVDHGFSKRLSQVESDLAGISAKQDAMEHAIEKVGYSLDRLTQRIDERAKPQWNVLISLAAVMVTLGGIYSTLSLSPIQQRQEWIFHAMQRHFELEGHKPAIIRIAALEETVSNLDIVLQREMRLLDQQIEQRIDREDVRLQREMDLKNSILSERIEAVAKSVLEVAKEQRDRTKRVYSIKPE